MLMQFEKQITKAVLNFVQTFFQTGHDIYQQLNKLPQFEISLSREEYHWGNTLSFFQQQ